MISSCKYLLFFVTGPENSMRELAKKLVEEKLAACVNVVNGIKSIYWWEDKVNEDIESLLIIKTESSKTQELINFIKSNHPYRVPEIIGLEISAGNPEYLSWIFESVTGKNK